MFSHILTWVRRVASIALLLILLSFVLSNREHIVLELFPLSYSVEFPLYILVFAMLTLGLIIGYMLARLKTNAVKSELRKIRKKTEAMDNELQALRISGAKAGSTSSSHSSAALPGTNS